METISINRANVQKAFNEAEGNKDIQKMLRNLFGNDVEDGQPKSIMERVKTFDDACHVLGNDNQAVIDYYAVLDKTATKDIVAYMELRIITEALNEGWHPTFADGEYRYSPWFYFYTKEEFDVMDEEAKACVVGQPCNNANACGGLVCACSDAASSHSDSNDGSRLAFKSGELPVYAGKQFIEIWADYIFA